MIHVVASIGLIEYRLFHEGRHHGFEDKTNIEALTEIIGMPGHPLKFQARLDGKSADSKGLADAQAQGESNLVSAVGPGAGPTPLNPRVPPVAGGLPDSLSF
jgi:hypothetical protein